MDMILCKKSFKALEYNYIEGEMYYYWTNFQGLNHFVSDKEYSKGNKNIIPFDDTRGGTIRSYLYDYFYTKEEMREIKINKIIEC